MKTLIPLLLIMTMPLNAVNNKYVYLHTDDSICLMESPGWQSKRLFKIKKNMEFEIINELKVYKDTDWWFKVRKSDGIQGWMVSGFLRNKITGLTPIAELITREQIIGEWVSGPSESAYVISFEFNKDKTFLFKGYLLKEFTSKGAWDFDNNKKILSLKFMDHEKYWEMMFKDITENFMKQDNIIRINNKQLSMSICLLDYNFNFLGHGCFKKNIK